MHKDENKSYDLDVIKKRIDMYKEILINAEKSIKDNEHGKALETLNRLLLDYDMSGDMSALECALNISAFARKQNESMPNLINYLQCVRRYRPLNDEELTSLEKQLGLIGGALAMANSVLREDENYYHYAKYNLIRDGDPQELADFESQAMFSLAKRFFKEP